MATPFDGIGGLLGIDPAQLQQLMAQFAPSEEDRKAANMQALAQLGFGLLGTRKGYEWDQVGNAAQNALQARQGALHGAQQGKADQFKMAQGLAKYKQEQDAAKRKQGVNEVLANLFKGGNPTADMPDRAPTIENAAKIPQGKAKWQIYEEAARIALENEDVPRAKEYAAMADANRPKLKDQKTLTQNGQRVVVNTYSDGTTQVLPDLGPDAEKLHFANTGGMAGVGLDPFSGAQVSQGLPVTMDAAQKDASARGWAQYGLSKAAADRAAKEGAGGGKPQLVNGQWVFPPDAQNPTGRAVTPAGMETKAEKPSDEQLKTGGFVERMQFADKYISAIESDTLKPGTNVVAKEGYRPGAGEGMVQGLGGVPLVGGVLGKAGALTQAWVEPRAAAYKNVKKAWIRAKLRKESGAVIGAEEEADEDRTFFPQPGDPVEVVKQKAALRKNVEQSMARQARGGYQGGAVQDDPLGLRR